MKTSAPSKENCLLQTKNLGLVFGAEPSLLRKGLCRRHLGVRRPDAAFATTSALFQGGVKPPHSKALRAFSCSLGARQPTGRRDNHENRSAGFQAAPDAAGTAALLGPRDRD
jgi:hypothetical protein